MCENLNWVARQRPASSAYACAVNGSVHSACVTRYRFSASRLMFANDFIQIVCFDYMDCSGARAGSLLV